MTTVSEKILPKIYETKLRYVILMHGTLVPKLTIGPILTLSVKNGYKFDTWFLGSRLKLGVKFKTSFWSKIKILKGVLLYQNPWPFSRQCQVFNFQIYPEFKSLHIAFSRQNPLYEYSPLFRTNLTFITSKINHWM